MPDHTPKFSPPQQFLEHKARHERNLRRARRNSYRLLRALSSIGVAVSWDGKFLRVHGPRLRARTKNRIRRLGIHFISAVETLSRAAMTEQPSASELVQ